jgi:BirA family biotin operon repressor/biotin-[acetyl-CoA-carboxylase] ligase
MGYRWLQARKNFVVSGKIGRKLIGQPEEPMLTIKALQDSLKRPVRYFPQVDSTQDIALAWIDEGADAGSVVICDEQLRGRGRLKGRTWHTPAGVSLAVSVILMPKPEVLPHVTMLGAVAIAQMIESYFPDSPEDVRIKWPNDVKLRGRKISGVLAEANWHGSRLTGVVLGMGVNVRADFTHTEFAHTAISLETVLGKSLNRVELFRVLLHYVDHWSAWLGSDRLFQAWTDRLETIGQTVEVNGITGVAQRVEPCGALIVCDEHGQEHRILAGDIIPSE